MNIAVTIKQAPETSNAKVDPETGTMIREGLDSFGSVLVEKENIVVHDSRKAEDMVSIGTRDETLPDQWEAQILARVLMKHKVIMVTDPKNHGYVRDMHMTPASTIYEALKTAEDIVGRDSTINVIPDGVSVIISGYPQ